MFLVLPGSPGLLNANGLDPPWDSSSEISDFASRENYAASFLPFLQLLDRTPSPDRQFSCLSHFFQHLYDLGFDFIRNTHRSENQVLRSQL